MTFGLRSIVIQAENSVIFGIGAYRTWNRRLQIGRSGPFSTGFLPHSWAMGLQIRRKLCSLGPIFAFGAPSPTGS
ncbi:MAG: hypothetical protein LBQ32_13025, partial [Burkholderiaceae bacterium]|nr:hypothetical protein [Burkholderiaceae bacterium]